MSNLSRWNPFNEPFFARNDFARLVGLPVNRTEGEELSNGWSPAVDIYEDGDGITVKAEVPGVEPKDVEVKIENGTMTLKGERKLEKQDKKDNYTRVERFHGSFTRSFTIPPQVDVDKVHAETKNGVLNIFLPKKPETKPKQISVKVS